VVRDAEQPGGRVAGTRKVPFARDLYIEQDDFMEDPPKKFFRLAPGREVRLRSAYFITCTEVVKDDDGRDRRAPLHLRSGRRAAAMRPTAVARRDAALGLGASTRSTARSRLYDRLFLAEDPEDVPDGQDFLSNMNPDSLRVITHAKLEPSVKGAAVEARYQFERLGYFVVDPDSTADHMVFNRTVTLKDTWAKVAAK
jgi:glutaminyl-tRNA synthetase